MGFWRDIMQIETSIDSKKAQPRLWTPNFVLLWQGQLVSAFGDRMYYIALGFWVMAMTGSTAMMGMLMAASSIPRVLLSPFAGVIVDRTDRKKMLVLMDLIRGAAVLMLSVAAIQGFITLWMVFASGIIIGICGAFFNPAIKSTLPDIVPESKIVKANSVFNMAQTAVRVVGSSVGGYLYQVIEAPLMFLINGVSYIFSGITEMFIKIPKVEKRKEKVSFIKDFKEGLIFVWELRGLRYLLSLAGFVNFCGNVALVLWIPIFTKDANLGSAKYGIFMAFLTGGMFLGMLFTSIVDIPYSKRFHIFLIGNIISSLCYALWPLFNSYILMLILIFVAGFSNSVYNVFLTSSIQLNVPADKRGKVYGLMGTLFQGLTPIAMALGGIIATFVSPKLVNMVSYILVLGFATPLFFSSSFKQFLNHKPKT